jgi:hypothetical protein
MVQSYLDPHASMELHPRPASPAVYRILVVLFCTFDTGDMCVHKMFKSYRTGHVLAATWRMPPPGSQHPGPSSTPSSSDKLTSLIDRNQVDCGA